MNGLPAATQQYEKLVLGACVAHEDVTAALNAPSYGPWPASMNSSSNPPKPSWTSRSVGDPHSDARPHV